MVAGLLALHGLHPRTVDERVRAALADVTGAVGDAGRVELVGVERGVVSLRVVDGGGSASVLQALAQVAVRAVEQAAPEVTRVEVTGLPPPPAAAPPALISVDHLLAGGRR